MIIGAPKEVAVDEKRVAMTPDSAKQLQKLGYDCLVQSGAGQRLTEQDSHNQAFVIV